MSWNHTCFKCGMSWSSDSSVFEICPFCHADYRGRMPGEDGYNGKWNYNTPQYDNTNSQTSSSGSRSRVTRPQIVLTKEEERSSVKIGFWGLLTLIFTGITIWQFVDFFNNLDYDYWYEYALNGCISLIVAIFSFLRLRKHWAVF